MRRRDLVWGTVVAGVAAVFAIATTAPPGRSPGLGLLRTEPDEEVAPDLPAQRPRPRAWRPPVLEGAAPAQAPAVARRVPEADPSTLARTRGWLASVLAFHGLPALPAPEARARLVALLAAAREPVIRQNLIFHLALGVRDGLVGLEAEALELDADDLEDLEVARAFAGEPAAVASFVATARVPSAAAVHRLMDRHDDMEALGEAGGAGARAVLRSYHAIEVLDREPYFDMLAVRIPIAWKSVAEPTPEPLRSRLEEAWLARWPGHPGADDVALRLARTHLAAGRHLEAARWYGRSATLPDQDVTRRAVGGMVALAELYLDREDLLGLAEEEGLATPNHELLLYVLARRTAAEVGPEEGLDVVREALRRADVPTLEAAWHRRWAVVPPKGLSSGLVPLPEDDPLRRRTQQPVAATGRASGATARRTPDERRLAPHREAVHLDGVALAVQLRTWETLAELDDRAGRARRFERADVAYKAAAVLFHQRDAYYPVYAWHTWSFGASLYEAWRRDPQAFREGADRFQATTFSWRRALDAFEAILAQHPESDLLDRVRFSMGLCWRRLLDYRPRHVFTGPDQDDDLEEEAVANLIAHMASVTRLHPTSPLADDAARAVAWWRGWQRRHRQARR